MPYDPNNSSTLPAYVQKLPAKRRRQWAHIWNSSYSSCMNGAEPDSGNCESKAFSTASGVAIKQKGKAKHSMDEQTNTSENASFKKLSYKARQKLPKKKFLFIDSEGKPHLPVHDQSHVRNAISRLGNPKTGRNWGLSADKRVSLQNRARKMLDRAAHNQGPPISPHADLAMDVAEFKVKPETLRETDEVVYKPATIFRAGEYPDKDFSLTPSELTEAAAKFDQPIYVDYEHIDGPLDGHMGQLVALAASGDGSKLHGMVAIPKWLDAINPNAKLSATWDRASKTLVGLAMVRNPRVADAAIFAAFSADQVSRGLDPVQIPTQFNGDNDGDDDDDDDKKADDKNPFAKLAKKKNKAAKKKAKFAGYDGMVPQGGWESQSGGARDGISSLGDIGKKGRQYALGKGPYGTSQSGSRAGVPKRAMAQAIHDMSTSKGAVCRVEPEPAAGAPGPYGIVRFDDQGNFKISQKKLAKFANGNAMQGIHDVSLAMGASCLYGQRDLPGGGPWQWEWPGVKDEGFVETGGNKKPHFSEEEKEEPMGKKAQAVFNEMLARLDDGEARTPAAYNYAGKQAQPKTGLSDPARALAERNAQLEAENRQMRQQRIYDQAVAFADKALNESKILPVEREWVIQQHMQAAHDDTFVGTASFAEGSSRVAQFEQGILGRPKGAGVDVEQVMTAMRGASAVFNNMRTAVVPGASGQPGVDSGAPMAPERRQYLLNLAESGTMTGKNLARSNGTSK